MCWLVNDRLPDQAENGLSCQDVETSVVRGNVFIFVDILLRAC